MFHALAVVLVTRRRIRHVALPDCVICRETLHAVGVVLMTLARVCHCAVIVLGVDSVVNVCHHASRRRVISSSTTHSVAAVVRTRLVTAHSLETVCATGV